MSAATRSESKTKPTAASRSASVTAAAANKLTRKRSSITANPTTAAANTDTDAATQPLVNDNELDTTVELDSDPVVDSAPIDECCVCLSEVSLPILTPCKHLFCFLCIKAVQLTAQRGYNQQRPSCPLCRGILPDSVFTSAALATDEWELKHRSTEFVWKYSGRTGGWWVFDDSSNILLEQNYQLYSQEQREQLIKQAQAQSAAATATAATDNNNNKRQKLSNTPAAAAPLTSYYPIGSTVWYGHHQIIRYNQQYDPSLNTESNQSKLTLYFTPIDPASAAVTGTISGSGTDNHGSFDVIGTYSGPTVQFKKQYNLTNSANYTAERIVTAAGIELIGTFKQKQTIKGKFRYWPEQYIPTDIQSQYNSVSTTANSNSNNNNNNNRNNSNKISRRSILDELFDSTDRTESDKLVNQFRDCIGLASSIGPININRLIDQFTEVYQSILDSERPSLFKCINRLLELDNINYYTNQLLLDLLNSIELIKIESINNPGQLINIYSELIQSQLKRLIIYLYYQCNTNTVNNTINDNINNTTAASSTNNRGRGRGRGRGAAAGGGNRARQSQAELQEQAQLLYNTITKYSFTSLQQQQAQLILNQLNSTELDTLINEFQSNPMIYESTAAAGSESESDDDYSDYSDSEDYSDYDSDSDSDSDGYQRRNRLNTANNNNNPATTTVTADPTINSHRYYQLVIGSKQYSIDFQLMIQSDSSDSTKKRKLQRTAAVELLSEFQSGNNKGTKGQAGLQFIRSQSIRKRQGPGPGV